MDLISIFADKIWSVRYDGDEDSIFEILYDRFTDVEFLHNFYKKHITEINNSIWKNRTEEEFVEEVTREADSFFERLEQIDKDGSYSFDCEFMPLSNNPKSLEWVFEKQKAKGKGPNYSWPSYLRLYAVKIDKNKYIITGGGIKLVRCMQDSSYLVEELKKIDKVIKWLKEKGVNISKECGFLEAEE
ncbi:MAG: hypothetical protein IKP37_08870 [Paludibacteraceae bacterium]|nr:hypothetical protein [Paludibacteraceae bacterium]